MRTELSASKQEVVLNYGDPNPNQGTSVKMRIARPKHKKHRRTPKHAKAISTSKEAKETLEEKKEVAEQEVTSKGLDDFDINSQASSEHGARTPLALYMKYVRDTIEKNKFYPPIARRLRQEGIVKIQITINKEGKIEEAQVIEGKYPALKDAAMKIVTERSTFPSFLEDIKKERMKITIPINFEII